MYFFQPFLLLPPLFFLFWQPLKFVRCTSNLTDRKTSLAPVFFFSLFATINFRINLKGLFFAWFSLMWSSLLQSLRVLELYSFSQVIFCQIFSRNRIFKGEKRSTFSGGQQHLRSSCFATSFALNWLTSPSLLFAAHVPFNCSEVQTAFENHFWCFLNLLAAVNPCSYWVRTTCVEWDCQ